jgi:hypothetical protein
MTSRETLARLSVLAVLAFALLTVCCWWDTRWLDFNPIDDAEPTAKRHAAANGYRMEGYRGDFSQEPDADGGCEVRIVFYDCTDDPPKRKVTVKLRRTWRLAGWNITGMTVEAAEK